ncbi:hypothetical protein [Micromonospora sp. NPDC053811]|uniref:hypothetical protein n=1 Tax=Micromonospora sp. NPDC053811 TaxID=3154956 RepID=UPI00343985DE
MKKTTGTRLHVAALAVTGLTLLAGCAEPGAAEWVAPDSKAAAAASPTGPARPKAVTSACKILTADAVIDLLGGTSSTKLKAREAGVEDLGDGAKRYTCGYGRDGAEPFALSVTERPDPDGTVVESIDQIADYADGEVKRITGLGDGIDGLTYVKDNLRGAAVAVPYQKQLRIAVFLGPQQLPRDKMVEVVQHLVTRL